MKSRNATISPEACEAIAHLHAKETAAGWEVRLSDKYPHKVYCEIDDLFERLGGRWTRQLQAHLFPVGVSPLPAIQEAVEGGAVPDKNPLAHYASTLPVIENILTYLQCGAGYFAGRTPFFLEPSAGSGGLVRALVAANHAARIDCIEIDPRRYGILSCAETDLVTAHLADFLTWCPPNGRSYDRIAMNPPFAVPADPLAYIAHIRRAYSFLKPTGRLVSVAPASFVSRVDKKTATFRQFVRERGFFADLPSDAFADSGTMACTCLVVLQGEAMKEARS